MKTLSTGQIATLVQGSLTGSPNLTIDGMNTLEDATPSQMTFIRDQSHLARWKTSKAVAAIVGPEVQMTPQPNQAVIQVKNADLAVALILENLAPHLEQEYTGRHPTAVVSPQAIIGDNVSIGPYSVIGANAKIGDGCIIHSHVTIEQNCEIGRACQLHPGVVVGHHCIIGNHCILHPNVVIGADGFGYRPSADGKKIVKIPQIGIVRIGHEVELGAGTCVDRAKFAATTIGDQTKIDNQCQIAHNCKIGQGCLFAAQVALAGSVTIGHGVMIGGQSAVKDHATVGNGANIAGCSTVMQDIPAGATWGGYPAQDLRATMREIAAVRKLPELIKLVKKLQPR